MSSQTTYMVENLQMPIIMTVPKRPGWLPDFLAACRPGPAQPPFSMPAICAARLATGKNPADQPAGRRGTACRSAAQQPRKASRPPRKSQQAGARELMMQNG